jgi:hypothetical protein
MNTTQRYKLIEGDFAPDKAAHVLLSLVKSKIDYHNVEKLSNTERFGKDITHSERRLNQLHELRRMLQDACRNAEHSDEHLRVRGWIEIESIAPEHSGAKVIEPAMCPTAS